MKRTNSVVITNLRSGFRIHLKRLEGLVHLILKKLDVSHASLSLVFVSDQVIKRLNQRYLNHPWVTDVLAFPFVNFKGAPHFSLTQALSLKGRGKGDGFLGEVVISPRRAQVYVNRFHVLFQEEFVRYICHGILHLKGYTDHSVRARNRMRRAEDELIQSLSAKIKGII